MSAALEARESLTSSASQESVVVDVIASLYRLLKLTRMYEENNQALVTGADAAVSAIQAFCASHGVGAADLMFASETVFVNGQMPKLSREAYARTMELAELLDKAGVSSVTLPRTATASDLIAFLRLLVAAIREPARHAELTDKAGLHGIRARKLRRAIGTPTGEGDRSPAGRVVRTYACAVVLLRRLHAGSAKGRAEKMPRGLARIAQRIVGHAEEEPGLLVALAAARARENDEASIAVATALVAVLMAKQVTKDRGAMANVTQAALLYHLGRARMLALRGEGSVMGALSPLSEEEQDRLPASGAAAIAALDKIDAVTLPRAVIAFEAEWTRRAGRLGSLYRGKRATSVLARILAVARSFAELMAPGPYAAAMGPEDAIHFLATRAGDETDRAFVKLLTGGLGIFPPGTMVELSTGEVGVVMRVPTEPVNFARPPVRVMYDDAGNLLERPFDVDLASAAWGATQRLIRRSVDTDEQQTQAMRAYVLSVTRGEPTEQRKLASATDSQSGKRPLSAPRLPDTDAARTGGSPSSSGASTTARRRRSFEDRPKVFDARAEPEDDGPPRRPAIAPRAAPAAPPVTIPAPPQPFVKPRQEAIRTRPAMEAVRPTIHEQRTEPPPASPVADPGDVESAPTRGFALQDAPREALRETSRPVARSTTAGTRKVAWEDYEQIVDEETPGRDPEP
jgi:hypothetical protein